ncbi:hypothetical protein K439DRAFT_1613280 [Ramaria rubella]|nr:hypothetical protein K439DRAFT_1613280 [Ramaria rubella]
MPTWFQHTTGAEVDIAVKACRAVRSRHYFSSVGKEGLYGVSESWHFLVLYLGQVNRYLPIILQVRGGTSGPNYAVPHVRVCGEKLANAGRPQTIVVCTTRPHTRSPGKKHTPPFFIEAPSLSHYFTH